MRRLTKSRRLQVTVTGVVVVAEKNDRSHGDSRLCSRVLPWSRELLTDKGYAVCKNTFVKLVA